MYVCMYVHTYMCTSYMYFFTTKTFTTLTTLSLNILHISNEIYFEYNLSNIANTKYFSNSLLFVVLYELFNLERIILNLNALNGNKIPSETTVDFKVGDEK